jgi:hypothetical protein
MISLKGYLKKKRVLQYAILISPLGSKADVISSIVKYQFLATRSDLLYFSGRTY